MSSAVCCRRSFSSRNWIPYKEFYLKKDFRINPINVREMMWNISKCNPVCQGKSVLITQYKYCTVKTYLISVKIFKYLGH